MVLFIISILGCTRSEPKKSENLKPDIILVSIDSLRRDHLSIYGYSRKTSPFIDSLAEIGSRFENARSTSSWTLPAHVTMMTGLPSVEHQIIEDSLKVDPSMSMLAENFAEAGYETGGFVSATFVSSLYGFNRGFKTFKDYDLFTDKHNLNASIDAKRLVDDALRWRKASDGSKPAFLFLHFYDAHYEYAPPAPHDTLFDRAKQPDDLKYKNYFHHLKNPLTPEQMTHQIAQYDEGIHYVDAQLKRLNDAMKAAGKEVIWVITSDHGEEFGERGTWGHAHTLYSEQLDIPLVFSGPGIPKAIISDDVGLSDVAPTLATLGAIKPPKQSIGRDLLPAMSGKQLRQKEWVAETSRFNTNRLSLKKGDYRLEWDLNSNTVELYHVQQDPKEKTNLSIKKPAKAAELKQEILKIIDKEAWSVRQNGLISVSKGALIEGGLKQHHHYSAGEGFSVWPVDARVRHVAEGTDTQKGPFSILAKKRPKDADPVEIKQTKSTAVQKSEGVKNMLEQLGYMQED